MGVGLDCYCIDMAHWRFQESCCLAFVANDLVGGMMLGEDGL